MSDPRHERVDERLCDWVDGRMNERERERFAAELRVNPSLRQQLAEYERTVAAIRAALQAPTRPVSAGDPTAGRMADRVFAALASQQNRAAQPVVAMPWRGRSWRHLGWCAASAAALLVLALWIDSWAGREPEKTALVAAAEEPAAGRPGEPAPTASKPGAATAYGTEDALPGEELRKQEAADAAKQDARNRDSGSGDPGRSDASNAVEREGENGTAPVVGGGGGGGQSDPPAGGFGSGRGAPSPGRSAAGEAKPVDRAKVAAEEPKSAGAGDVPRAAEGGVDKSPVGDSPPAGVARGEPSPGLPAPSTAGGLPAGAPAPGESEKGREDAKSGWGAKDEALVDGRGVPVRSAAPFADGPWPEVTIVGAEPAGADLPDSVRLLLGFVAEGERQQNVTKDLDSARSAPESADEPKAKRAAASPTPRPLPEAELVRLMAGFLRTARTNPATHLQWPTRSGGVELQRFPAAELLVAEAKSQTSGAAPASPQQTAADASRLRADDVLWVVEGSDEELRLLLAQLGRSAVTARWQLTPGEFAVDLQQRVLADAQKFFKATTGTEETRDLAEPAVPTQPGGGAAGLRGAAPVAGTGAGSEGPVAGRTSDSAGASGPAGPTGGGGAPAAGAAARRRLVLRFRSTP